MPYQPLFKLMQPNRPLNIARDTITTWTNHNQENPVLTEESMRRAWEQINRLADIPRRQGMKLMNFIGDYDYLMRSYSLLQCPSCKRFGAQRLNHKNAKFQKIYHCYNCGFDYHTGRNP